MHEFFEIKPSSAQLIFIVTSHGLAAGGIYFYLQPTLLMVACLALSGLLAIDESRSLIRREIITLRVHQRDASIGLEQGGQPYFYSKYKVYQTRWFAILKLIDEHESRTLILNPDCFNSTRSYQRLRYSLRSEGLRSEGLRKDEPRNAA